jgi:hypothetical protein
MIATARLAVGVSFVVTSVLGFSFVFAYWANQSVVAAAGRGALFLAILGCVHLVGYLLYVDQFRPATVVSAERQNSFDFWQQYGAAVKDALVVQGVFGVLTGLMLDGGRSFKFFTVALMGHWLTILLIIGRRPMSPTKFDIFCIRWGLVFAMLLVGVIAPAVWSIIGESHLSGLERLLGE